MIDDIGDGEGQQARQPQQHPGIFQAREQGLAQGSRGAHPAQGAVQGRVLGQVQEQIDQSLGAGLLKDPWTVEDGYIALPTKPGLGIEIDEDALGEECVYSEELGGEFLDPSDGSVADW